MSLRDITVSPDELAEICAALAERRDLLAVLASRTFSPNQDAYKRNLETCKALLERLAIA